MTPLWPSSWTRLQTTWLSLNSSRKTTVTSLWPSSLTMITTSPSPSSWISAPTMLLWQSSLDRLQTMWPWLNSWTLLHHRIELATAIHRQEEQINVAKILHFKTSAVQSIHLPSSWKRMISLWPNSLTPPSPNSSNLTISQSLNSWKTVRMALLWRSI